MTVYKFKRRMTSFQLDGSVMHETAANQEAIEVADDWQIGKEVSEKGLPYETTGYVGKGYSKYGIYVRLSYFGNSLLICHQLEIGEVPRKRICHGSVHR